MKLIIAITLLLGLPSERMIWDDDWSQITNPMSDPCDRVYIPDCDPDAPLEWESIE